MSQSAIGHWAPWTSARLIIRVISPMLTSNVRDESSTLRSPCFCWQWYKPRILIFHDGGGGGGLLNNFALIRRPLLGDFRHEIDTPSQRALSHSRSFVYVCVPSDANFSGWALGRLCCCH